MGPQKNSWFPESPRVIYRKNPLAEVICQIRFPTILRIGAGDVSIFQDIIRQEYPLYELQQPVFELKNVPKELTAFIEQAISKQPTPQIHRFLTKDSQRFIALAPDFFALSESKYTKWDLFQPEIIKAETALKETFQPTFYSRVGLRYKDVISRSALGLQDAKWSELIQPHILGLLGIPAIMDKITQIQTRCSLRVADIPGGYVTLVHGIIREGEDSESLYLIDADFFTENLEGLKDGFDIILDKFNKLAGRLFRWAITDKLHKAMEPERL